MFISDLMAFCSFFKLKGKWPLAFTIWIYDESKKQNDVNLHDLTEWKRTSLNTILWENKDKEKETDKLLNKTLEKTKLIKLTDEKSGIRELLPLIERRGKIIQQGRVNLYRNKTKELTLRKKFLKIVCYAAMFVDNFFNSFNAACWAAI